MDTFGTFVFTDIVKSSKLWSNHPDKMSGAMDEHYYRIYSFVDTYNGIVVKTIGDAFMLFFDNFQDALFCMIEIQGDLKYNPIRLSQTDQINIRVGMCTGPANTKKVNYQGIELDDYFGTTVNIASRMESKVASINQIAFSFFDTAIPYNTIDYISQHFKISEKNYKNTCNSSNKRSSRLLNYECLNEEMLHGVPGVEAFVINL